MEYDNPEIPEGINVSPQKPLRELFLLLGGAAALVILTVVLLGALAGWLAGRLPFAYEQQLTGNLPVPVDISTDRALVARLQALADGLAKSMELPVDMRITVHLAENSMVNAFATLGGHVYVFRGLLDAMPDENTFSMVLAHEIAHIKHRDPIRSLGRGAIIMLTLSALFGASDSSVANTAAQGASVGLLHYSREQELAADRAALAALNTYYGHAYGAQTLFDTLAVSAGKAMPQFEILSSHPFLSNRKEQIGQLIARQEMRTGQKPTPAFWRQERQNR